MTRMMKDSGVEWIGKIPESWDVKRVKYIFIRKDAKAQQEEPVVLSLARSGVKVRDLSTNEGQVAASYYNYNPVAVGDLLLNPMDLYSGANCSISKVEGVISPAYVNLKNKHGYNSVYYDYFFKTMYWSFALFSLGKGVSFDNRWTLGNDTLFNIKLPAPPTEEQQKIAEFLDEKCGAFDEIISKTEQSIEEYKKLKQSVITKAVTKGIRPNRPMQDSNIEWIGEIPTDWEIKRFRYIADKFLKGSGITKDDVKEDGNIKCVRYGEIYSKYNYTFNDCLSCTNVEEISTPQYFSYGDLLFAGTGELIEEIGKSIVYLGNDKCLAGGDIIVVKHRHNPAFLNYTLNSDVAIYQKSRNKIKLKVVHISAAEIKNIIVPLPPLDEQKEIADYLDEKCSEIDTLIEKKQQFLAEMANYKKSLIYEYVTGKKEVA